MSADDGLPSDMIATLRIDLLGSDPPIWREIEVTTSMTLKQLHAVVQAAMGWEDAHLWEFAVGRERIGSGRAAKQGPDRPYRKPSPQNADQNQAPVISRRLHTSPSYSPMVTPNIGRPPSSAFLGTFSKRSVRELQRVLRPSRIVC